MNFFDKFSDLGCFVTLMLGALFLLLVAYAGTAMLDRAACYSKWSEFNPTWGVLTGCMIETNGKRIPSSNYRELL